MIDWLEIHQLAIAERIALEFGDSFTAVTGETGSGKSLIIGAIGILLGDRCENSLIRRRQEKAEIVGGFKLAATHPARRWLRDNNLDNGDECILRRVARRDKPSRAYINGHAVNASQLRELGAELVDLHGQNEHHSLLNKKAQLARLDSAAGNADSLAEIGRHYTQLARLRAQIERLEDHNSLARERADLLQFQIAELEALAPEADEWPRLEQQQKRMHHAHDLASGARAVAARLSDHDAGDAASEAAGEQSIAGGAPLGAALADCRRQLQRLTEYDARLGAVTAMLEEASVNLSESVAQLQAVCADSLLNPDELAAIETRFSQYHELARNHRVLPGLLADKLEQLRAELAGLQDPQADMARLEGEWRRHKAGYDRLARAIGKQRGDAAAKLSAKVTELMQELGMAGGAFDIRLKSNDQGRMSRRGDESADFVVSANPGMPLQPLNKVASGGELSRISLAINVVLAADAADAALIFDEVDVGIGGKVAETVGQKLRQLGVNRQVICITHLSQVAACGHHHWSVTKQTGAHARVSARPLNHQQRIEEIARMTAGAELTPQSLAHAMRMLELACA